MEALCENLNASIVKASQPVRCLKTKFGQESARSREYPKADSFVLNALSTSVVNSPLTIYARAKAITLK
jgi:hypothetical protein